MEISAKFRSPFQKPPQPLLLDTRHWISARHVSTGGEAELGVWQEMCLPQVPFTLPNKVTNREIYLEHSHFSPSLLFTVSPPTHLTHKSN